MALATNRLRGEHPDHSNSPGGLPQAAEEAVRRIHALGVAHGDLRPENIILVSDEHHAQGFRVFFIDFGYATLVEDINSAEAQELFEEELNALSNMLKLYC